MRNRIPEKFVQPLLLAGSFAVVGIATLILSQAAINPAVKDFEAEIGALSGDASKLILPGNDTSGGALVRLYSNAPSPSPSAAPLPTFQKPVKIIAIGDSITQGFNPPNGPVGYRFKLQDKLRAANCSYDMVGPYTLLNSGQTMAGYDNDHAAKSSYRADEVNAEFDGWLQPVAAPNAALILLGINDIYEEVNLAGGDYFVMASNTANDINALIQKLRAKNPSVAIYLAQITGGTHVNNDHVAYLNGSLQSVAISTTTAQSPVVLVDMNSDYSLTADHADGVHPNASGIEKIAARWMAALQPLLKANNICN